MIINFDIQTFLLIYMTIFFLLIIYNIYCILQRKIVFKIVNKNKKKLNNVINKHLKERKLKDGELEYLINKLNKINYLLAFNKILEERKEEPAFKTYLNKRTVVFTTLAQKYDTKSTSKKSFYSYVLANLPIKFDSKVFITKFLLKNIISTSISLRENSFIAICNCCNEETVYNALKLLNRNNIMHSNELISNDMDKADLDNKILAELLMNKFGTFNENYKLAIIKYIGKTKLNYKDNFYNILISGNETKEVNLAILKYFANHKDIKIVKILLNNLSINDKNNWEYAAISAKVLGNYNRPRVIEGLKEAITSKNWYVRNNAATSLLKLVDDKETLNSILNGDDKYAKEILTYKLKRKGMKKNA